MVPPQQPPQNIITPLHTSVYMQTTLSKCPHHHIHTCWTDLQAQAWQWQFWQKFTASTKNEHSKLLFKKYLLKHTTQQAWGDCATSRSSVFMVQVLITCILMFLVFLFTWGGWPKSCHTQGSVGGSWQDSGSLPSLYLLYLLQLLALYPYNVFGKFCGW